VTPQVPDDAARAVAFAVLRAVSEQGAYANLLLPQRLRKAGLSGRDAAFATELTYGTLRRSGTYDRIAAACVDRPWSGVDPPVRDLLRLGTHQLLGMQVPSHAAVATTVTLAKREVGPGRAGFVNAVLRRISTQDYDLWVDALLADTPGHDDLEALALRHAHPRWVVEAFARALAARDGADELEALLAADNEGPAVSLVARPGRCDVSELLDAGGAPGRWSPWAVVWPGGDPGRLPAVREHRAGVQDEGSQLVVSALLAAPVLPAGAAHPERWLDMCAGPGGKAALMAAVGSQQGATLAAWELQPHRARLVEQAIGGHGSATVAVVDAADPAVGDQGAGQYDRVLLDAPCTGTGALRRRPEARWRRSASDLSDLVALQRRLLANAMTLVRPGGVVGYVTCSPLLEETVEVVDAVRRALPADGFEPIDARGLLPSALPGLGAGPDLQLWPHRHGTDAMYLALLRRRS
jgi:16S rRNA (cytosine967-C5)-methyltransferase